MMKILATHTALGIKNSESGFNYLIETLRDSIRFWDYFVNWDKAFVNVDEQADLLDLWNKVVRVEQFEDNLRALIQSEPKIVLSIPALAVRDGAATAIFQIADDPSRPLQTIRHYDFSRPADTPELVESAIHFMNLSGLSHLLKNRVRGNLIDYLLGVEAGLDSNGRKNRGGSAMEAAVKQHIHELCGKRGFKYMEQATDHRMLKEWGHAGTEQPGRRYDFAILDGARLTVIEASFYSAGGSKLKATAGEFKGLAPQLNALGVKFVWVTDGHGWDTAKGPLKSAFESIDHVFNLELLAEGCLEDALST